MNKMLFTILLILPLAVVADDMEEAFQNSLSSNISYEDLLPLKQLASNATDDPSDLTYICVRCSALFTALASYFSNGVGAEENSEKLLGGAEVMLLSAMHAAKVGRQLTEAEAAEVNEGITRSVTTQVAIVTKRINNNFVVSGEGFGKDELLNEDLKVCGAVLASIRKKTAVK